MMSPSGAPIAVVFGTRPEAIKLAPVVEELRRAGMPHLVVTTGQHAEMVDEVLRLFGIVAHAELGLLRPGQSLDALLARAVEAVGRILEDRRPAAVVVQGDTTSMLGSTLAAFHHGIRVAHVEAGLRSGDVAQPFPEEINRRVASTIATWHFAPTERAAANLAREGIRDGVHVSGNTVVDALQRMTADLPPLPEALEAFIDGHPLVLATAHRRESWKGGIGLIATALRQVLEGCPSARLVFATHPNPIARSAVTDALGGHPRAAVVDAVPYPTFLGLLRRASVAVSDSGGVQEEGPTLGVPVLVTRSTTERPEGVDAGAVRLVGTDVPQIVDAALRVLTDADHRGAMAAAGRNLYGDGHAAERIVAVLRRDLAA
jgi:UDP-N-acetylglucosamine 2-epimerase (non-hydrolysing)